MSAGLELTIIDRLDAFEALSAEWDDLVRRADASPFSLSAYVGSNWRLSGTSCTCVVASRDGELVGAVPLGVRRRLGTAEGQLLNGRHRADVLCDARERASVPAELLRGVRELPVDWLPVYGVMPDAAVMEAVARTRLHSQHERVLSLEMPDGWEAAYSARTSAKSRNTDRRKRKRLNELGRIEFSVARDGEELQRALDSAFEVYRRRWEGRAGEAGGFRANDPGWRTVARDLGAAGHVLLVRLLIEGEAVAFTYSFVLNGTMWLHRLAFDPALGEYSPGWLTVLHTIAVASEAGARRVDFGLGQEPYKSRLATSETHVLWGTAMTRGRRGALAAGVNEARFLVRQRAKQDRRVLAARDRLFRLRSTLRGGSP